MPIAIAFSLSFRARSTTASSSPKPSDLELGTAMPQSFDVAVLIGSLRKASLTRKVANALIALAPPALHCRIVEISDLAMYNEDLESSVPEPWRRFREDVTKADAVLFLTPEYNRSIPACIKNAIDVASRPQGKNLWSGKPAGVVSVTPYKLGALGANIALRHALVFINVPAMQQPEAYIAGAADLFDEQGTLTKDDTREFFTKWMASFEQWIATVAMGAGAPMGEFESFMKQREKVAAAYSSGDASLLDAIVVHDGTATFFPPSGGVVSGAREVAAQYDAGAHAFSPGSTTALEVLQSGASGTLAFWTGFQNFEGKMGGKEMKLRLRITELFRREGGAWKLFHRHADPAGDAPTSR
jgi:NAD(P)H-dependent FMN reductase/ketosteroid isomerase-like protein